MDALQHYREFGLGEGRALDTRGTRLDADFSGTSYLAANRDVAMAGMDPLLHWLNYGSKEGRGYTENAADPYRFGAFNNVSQGAGPVVSGSFGAGITPSAPMGNVSSTAFGNANVSRGIGNGSFGAGIMGASQTPIGSFDFSGMNVAGGLGATSQGLGSPYAVASAAELGLGGAANPYGFGGDVSSFDVNSLGGALPGPGPGGRAQGGSDPLAQLNYFAISAQNAANNAMAQEAAAMQRNSIGVGAPNITFNPQVFNPGAPVASNQPAISVAPTLAPQMPAFSLNLSPGAMPGGGFAMSGFR